MFVLLQSLLTCNAVILEDGTNQLANASVMDRVSMTPTAQDKQNSITDLRSALAHALQAAIAVLII